MAAQFNQGAPTVPVVLNTSNCFVFGNTASGNALSVQQLGAGNVVQFSNAAGGSNVFVMTNTGRIGIGTTNPATALDVYTGTMNTASVVASTAYNTSGTGVYQVAGTTFIDASRNMTGVLGTLSATPAAAANVLTVIGSSTTGNVVQFSNSAGGNFVMTNAGNVGIGTTSPSQKLHVNAGNVYVQTQTSTVAVGQNLFVAVSGSSAAASSTDGITWTTRTLPSSSAWNAVTVNPNTGIFVAVAGGAASTVAASSTDGITWVARTLPSASWYTCTVNPTTGIFVALSRASTVAASSTDGFTWTARTLPFTSSFWDAVAVNPNTGIFAAVAQGTDAASSTDGITWVARTMPTNSTWYGCAVNPNTGIFVAVANNSTAAASSTDGITWTARTLPSISNWISVTANPTTGVFVTVANGPSTVAASSTDGITWTARTLPSSLNWSSVTANPTTGLFVAVANGTSAAASSTDGITWTARTLSVSTAWTSVIASYPGQTTTITGGYIGIGVASPAYQLDMSTDGARKLTTTTWLTGSDQRIKTDVESANLQTCYDVVKSVDLKYFKWNFPEGVVPDDKHSLGFIAQEVKEVFPNAVSESISYGYQDFLSLNVDQINKALFGAVKYLAAKVEALEQSLANASSLEPIPKEPTEP